MTSIWKPWEDHKDGKAIDIEGLQAPPCAACTHWNPQRIFRQTPVGFVFDGVALCHAEQFGDFSCFTARKAPDQAQ